MICKRKKEEGRKTGSPIRPDSRENREAVSVLRISITAIFHLAVPMCHMVQFE